MQNGPNPIATVRGSPALAAANAGGWRRVMVHTCCAIMGLVLLKWLCLESYFIPSASMQPTLLGSVDAGVHDRVVVDTWSHLLLPPQRWEVLAFRSPLNRRQAVAKRLVGLPGEQLRIVGGNVYRRDPSAPEGWRVLRKPDHVQRAMWREVYPRRGAERAAADALAPMPAAAWQRPDEDTLIAGADAGVNHELLLADGDGGLVDRTWDGCPLAVAQALRAATPPEPAAIVPDAKVELTIAASEAPAAFELAFVVRRPAQPQLRFAFVQQLDSARLVIGVGDDASEALSSNPFPCAVTSTPTRIAFAHVDDELIAWRDDEVIARTETAPYNRLEGCELPGGSGGAAPVPGPGHRVDCVIRVRSQHATTLRDLRIWRDVHYTSGPLAPNEVIDVPADQFFLLGDNPRQSEDSRGWRGIDLGIDAAGVIAPPDSALARRHRGALRLGDPARPPAANENPVFVSSHGLAVLVDEFGELRRMTLTGPASWHFGDLSIGDGPEAWQPPLLRHRFVPRDLIRGRVMARIWPMPPLGPWRPGWVR